MAIPTHLKNAPIQEAVIDIRAQISPEILKRKLQIIREEAAEAYSIVEEKKQVEHKLTVRDGQPQTSIKESFSGYFLTSKEKDKIAQFRVDGFTFSKLKPYTSWDQIIQDAIKGWQLYTRTLEPKLVSRIAARYINRIILPLPIPDLNVYFTSLPTVPVSFPYTTNSFLFHSAIRHSDQNIHVNITQTSEPHQPSKTELSVIIDIDVFTNGDFPIESEDLLAFFEPIHQIKNSVFFSCITDETVRHFQ
jgi:uncharacterized protein (TIGR04255 family)